MKAIHRRFIIQLLVLSIVVYVALYFISPKISDAGMPIISMVAFLFGVNALAFILVTNSKEKRPKTFVYFYMLISLVRIFLFSTFVLSYALVHRMAARPFVLTFFILYFLYSIIEVRAIYIFFNSKSID